MNPVISNLSKPNMDFIVTVSNTGTSKTMPASFALAKVLNSFMQLPSEKIEDITYHFRNTYRIEAESIISNINEICLLDRKTVLELTEKLYMFRYAMARGDDVLIAMKPETAIIDTFKLSTYFSEQDLKDITSNCCFLTECYNRFKQIIEELKLKG